jgi:hypothetical protein
MLRRELIAKVTLGEIDNLQRPWNGMCMLEGVSLAKSQWMVFFVISFLQDPSLFL